MMETITMKVADIKPAKYNPRKTLKPGDKEYEALSRSVDKFGMAVPIIVNKTTGTLISGHQRLNVLKAKGVEEVEVVLTEQTEDNEKLLNIALNKIEGGWDYRKLEALFEEIRVDDIQFTGFTPDELGNLFDNDLHISDYEAGEAEQASAADEVDEAGEVGEAAETGEIAETDEIEEADEADETAGAIEAEQPPEVGSDPGDPQVEKKFSIFLSFPTKELAEKWLKERKIDGAFKGTSRNVTVRMEGLEYGTGN